jgi:hypothetical protein
MYYLNYFWKGMDPKQENTGKEQETAAIIAQQNKIKEA